MTEIIYISRKNLVGEFDNFYTEDFANTRKVFKDTDKKEYVVEEIQEYESMDDSYSFLFVIKRIKDNKLFMVEGVQEMFDCDSNDFYSVFRNRYDQDTELLEFVSCNKVQVTVNKYVPETE